MPVARATCGLALVLFGAAAPASAQSLPIEVEVQLLENYVAEMAKRLTEVFEGADRMRVLAVDTTRLGVRDLRGARLVVVDWGLRRLMPLALEATGRPEPAARLRALAPVNTPRRAREARPVVEALCRDLDAAVGRGSAALSKSLWTLQGILVATGRPPPPVETATLDGVKMERVLRSSLEVGLDRAAASAAVARLLVDLSRS